jgi:ABC-type Fe3+-hydroxamate transport system substrate-binding protein
MAAVEHDTGAMRVVSLVPSVTETLLAWSVVPVACTRFCEQPALRHVGGTKNPDVAAIVDLAPDLVVVDEEENRREDHDALVAAGLDVHVLAIRSVADLDAQLPALAGRVGAAWEPLGELGAAAPAAVAAFVPIWRRPWMGLGLPTYGASLLAALGVAVVPGDAGPYPTVTLDDVGALAPGVVLVPSEPYDFKDHHLEELARIAQPVRVDGQDLLWWGGRTRAARGRLAAALAAVRGR